MKEREKLINLYFIYKNLLTDNQKNIFESYFLEDLSLTEISENMSVSRSYISKDINNIKLKLLEYENKLNILEKENKIKDIINTIKDEKIIDSINDIIGG